MNLYLKRISSSNPPFVRRGQICWCFQNIFQSYVNFFSSNFSKKCILINIVAILIGLHPSHGFNVLYKMKATKFLLESPIDWASKKDFFFKKIIRKKRKVLCTYFAFRSELGTLLAITWVLIKFNISGLSSLA